MAEDEVLDSWEDLEDSGELDRRLDNIKVKQVKLLKKSPDDTADKVTPHLVEDTQRSVFTPQVKILKRNTNSEQGLHNSISGSGSNAYKGYKSLQEREAAYAEARMRIFGAAQPPPDEEDGTSGGEGGDYSNSALAKQLETMRVEDATAVIRQPFGPDGTKGFNVHRQASVDR